MTVQEAIERLEDMLHCAKHGELRSYLYEQDEEALQMAIDALKVKVGD